MSKGKKKVYSLIILCVLSLSLSGCIDETPREKIGVIVSIIPQVEILEAIGGAHVEVTVMVPAGENPHIFEPTPNQMRKVAQATAYFMMGSGIEFEYIHMDAIREQNPGLEVFDCSQDIEVVSYDEHFGYNHYGTHHDNGEGDDEFGHDGTDPHVWTSPFNIKKMAQVALEGLLVIDPVNQSDYHANFDIYTKKIDTVHTTVDTLLQDFYNKSFMVYHPAWGYFGDTYHLKQIPIEEEGKEPGPAGIAAIIRQAKQENITIVFVAPQFDISNAETIAEEIRGQVVYANPLMTDYESTLVQLANDIVQGFQKY